MSELEKCFNKKLLSNVEPSNKKAKLSIKQAKDWLFEAEKNLENNT